MKTFKLIKLLLFSGVLFFWGIFISCKKEKTRGETNISAHNESRSHNAGQNCMDCHSEGGDGTGWFTVAGTVYKSDKTSVFSNTTVKLYTGKNGGGKLKYTIDGDELGNFFTTEQVNFGNGLFPAVTGINGTRFMSFSIKTGQCNNCHGVSQDVIWTE